MLVTDVSGSMVAKDVTPSRLVAARRAATAFLDERAEARSTSASWLSTSRARCCSRRRRDRLAVKRALERMKPSGGTATGDAIAAATGS